MLEDKIFAPVKPVRVIYEQSEQQLSQLFSTDMAVDHFSAFVCDLWGLLRSITLPGGVFSKFESD